MYHTLASLMATIASLRVRTAGRRGRQNASVRDIRDRVTTCVFCRDLHLTLMFSGLPQNRSVQRKVQLSENLFQTNYGHVCHTGFAVLILSSPASFCF